MRTLSRFDASGSRLIALLVAVSACGPRQDVGSTARAGSRTTATSSGAPASAIPEVPKPLKAEGNPFKNMKLWVDPESPVLRAAKSLRGTAPQKAKLLDEIARQPQALRVGAESPDVQHVVERVIGKASAEDAAPIFVLQSAPGRCRSLSSAGARGTADDYRRWIRKIAGLAGTEKVVFVLEPGALVLLDNDESGATCSSEAQQDSRLRIIWDAVKVLRQNPNAAVYLAAGNARAAPAALMAERLKRAGIEDAHGFALYTASDASADESLEYGHQLSKLVGGAPFVLDSSRHDDARDPKREPCSPPVKRPTTETGDPLIHAFLWLERPSAAEGECAGG